MSSGERSCDRRIVDDAAVVEGGLEKRGMMVNRVRLRIVEIREPLDRIAEDMIYHACGLSTVGMERRRTLIAIDVMPDDDVGANVVQDALEQAHRRPCDEHARIQAVIEGRLEDGRRNRVVVEQELESTERCEMSAVQALETHSRACPRSSSASRGSATRAPRCRRHGRLLG